MKNEELEEYIMQIMHENSGGIKFMELLSKLLNRPSIRDYADDLESYIRTQMSDRLLILEYEWISHNRIKMFVYTPITTEK